MKTSNDLFVFSIDSLTPETLPLVRLVQYLEQLVVLFGSSEHVHFLKVQHGSAEPAFLIDDVAAPIVLQRLSLLNAVDAPPELLKAFDEVNAYLRQDNAIGGLRAPGGATILRFPGRLLPAVEEVSVTERGALEGLLVRLGGRDRTAHATIEVDQGRFENVALSRELAKQLAPYLYGEEIRVTGVGKWKRSGDGHWRLHRFTAEGFELAPRGDLKSTFDQLAGLEGNAWREMDNPLQELLRMRGEE